MWSFLVPKAELLAIFVHGRLQLLLLAAIAIASWRVHRLPPGLSFVNETILDFFMAIVNLHAPAMVLPRLVLVAAPLRAFAASCMFLQPEPALHAILFLCDILLARFTLGCALITARLGSCTACATTMSTSWILCTLAMRELVGITTLDWIGPAPSTVFTGLVLMAIPLTLAASCVRPVANMALPAVLFLCDIFLARLALRGDLIATRLGLSTAPTIVATS